LGENFPKLLQASMPEKKMIATFFCITWAKAKNFTCHRAIVICDVDVWKKSRNQGSITT
jgi:hypothetical protein